MKNSILFVFFLFFVSVISAQSHTIKGKIINSVDVEGIHIINKTSRYNSVSSDLGTFEIEASINDTIMFSSIHYRIEEIIVTEKIYTDKHLEIELEKMVNQLDEVFIGNSLSGNMANDLKNINVEETFNFDDVGIPGFKGVPEEKIVPLAAAAIPTSVNIEALYKHITGYYKKLLIKRKWTSENHTIVRIINIYGFEFFKDAYEIPNNKLYDFLLFCIETTELQQDFKNDNLSGVLNVFETNSEEYISRIVIKKE